MGNSDNFFPGRLEEVLAELRRRGIEPDDWLFKRRAIDEFVDDIMRREREDFGKTINYRRTREEILADLESQTLYPSDPKPWAEDYATGSVCDLR